jgi:excisionase family DNA binding protein
MDKDVFLTVEQLSRRLGLSDRTLLTMRKNGKGPPYVVMGRSIRYRESDVSHWIDENIRNQTKVQEN